MRAAASARTRSTMRAAPWALVVGACAAATPNTRILFGSCNKHDMPQPLWPSVLERNPSAWIWGGDIIYGDYIAEWLPKVLFKPKGPAYLVEAYDRQNAVPGYDELLARDIPVIATWDDHDFGLNDADATLEFRDASLAAFKAAFPRADRGQPGVYSARTVDLAGGSVLVVALDMRYAKTPYDGPAGDGDFLSEAQWAWLEAVVDGSTADAHVFVSSLQLLEWRKGKAENWGRFPKAKARFIDVVARAKSAVVVSGDVHMAEIAGARCGSKLLLDVTSSGMTHSWARQSPVFPKYTVAPILTNGMRLAQRLLPFPYLLRDEGSGRSQNYLGLNFGELDFDFANGTLTARIFSEDGLELQHTFALAALGADGGAACEPAGRDPPGWESAIRFFLFAAIMAAGIFGAPLLVLGVCVKASLARPR